ncbi:MAG TPA: hypothetical protein VLL95_07975, partial [Phnomibacter sp.]|nr:hypothetical protein [Phnomibacter sp.]
INSTRTSSQFYFGYVSQYLLPLGKKFFGTATLLSKIGFTKLNERIELGGNNDTNGELYRLSFGIQPGLAYQLSKRWIADVSIGNLIAANFEHSRSRNSYNAAEYKNQNTSFNLNSIFSGNSSYLGIGFRYILR